MTTTIASVTVVLCLLTSLFCVHGQMLPFKEVPTWSKVETGRFTRTYSLTLGQEQDELYFMVDTINQRAYAKMSSVTTGAVLGEHWLIWSPPGALPGSNETHDYVYFITQDPNPNDDSPQSFCSYKTGSKIHFGSGSYYPPIAFPDHWDRQDIVKIQSWIEIPAGLYYYGVTFDNGVEYDVWVSNELCSVSDFGTLPCNKIATIKYSNIPSTVFLAQEAHGQFRNSWWFNDQFSSYQETTSTVSPPQNWLTTCFNLRNGFTLNPFAHAFVSTPEATDNFTLCLSGIPIDVLGPVVVTFGLDGGSCVDCIALEDAEGNPLESVEFSSQNWQDPVLIRIRYVKEGESYFFLMASGGGYEIAHYESYFTETGPKTISHGNRILTCAGGIAGFGCN